MEDRIARLLEKDAIVDTINQLFVSMDQRDWPAIVACLAPEVHYDMTSITGGEPVSLQGGQIAHLWQGMVQGLTAVHHLVGNHLVDVREQDADGSCHGIASHHLTGAPGGDTRVFFGSYHFHLTKRDGTWRIAGFRYALSYIQGNANLGQRA